MRNFTDDVLQASVSDIRKPMKASTFSWSVLRHDLFQRCPRAYFLHYYLAQGGWDKFANEFARSAYYEKYMSTLDQWMSETFQNSVNSALRKALIRPQIKQRRKEFSLQLLSALSKAVSNLQISLKNEEYLDDPKKPSIQEYLVEPRILPDLNDLISETVKTLSNAYGCILKTDILQEILELDFMDLHLDDQFLYFNYHNFPVWFRPGIVYVQKDTISMLNFYVYRQFSGELEQNKSWDLKSALFAQYCRERWGNYNVSNTALMFTNNTVAVNSTPNPIADLDSLIDGSSKRMLDLIEADGTVILENFKCSSEPEHCSVCQFRSTCKKILEVYH